MELLTKTLTIKETSEKASDRRRTFVASSDMLDADGDIVEQDWVLERYKANPVVLFAHKSRELPIGYSENIGVVDGKLQMDVVFASEKANPLAEQVFQSVTEKSLRAVSVGFLPGDVRLEKRDGKDVFVFSKNELYELSVTPVPSNAEALAKYKSKALGLMAQQPDCEEEHMSGEAKVKETDNQELSELRAEKVKLIESLAEKDAKIAALKERYDSLEARYNEEKERANAAALKNVETEIDALVGVKIAAAEKASLLKLAASDPELFAEHMTGIKARPDMGIVVEGPRLPPEAPQPSTKPSEMGGKKFDDMLRRIV